MYVCVHVCVGTCVCACVCVHVCVCTCVCAHVCVHVYVWGSIAKWLRRPPSNQKVPGLIPSWATLVLLLFP